MLELETHIPINEKNVESRNLAPLLSEEDRTNLGQWILSGYQADEASRTSWKNRMSAAMDLAMQMSKAKNFPWPNCSNIAFPLVTIAVLQFHSRAYPSLVNGGHLVKCKVYGPDPKGEKHTRAMRIQQKMSQQLLEEDQSWEEQHDRLTINVGCVGTAFKKTYRTGSNNKSELVMAKDLVMNYYAKSVEACGRKTHVIPLQRNDIHENILRGTFLDISDEGWYTSPTQPRTRNTEENRRSGTRPTVVDEVTDIVTLEQHVGIDLDHDGYAEPYIATIEETTGTLLRLVMRFDRVDDVEKNDAGKIISIRAREYFTKYGFIPSPDGGIYDIGFGILLGPLNESVNSIINQLVDAGTKQIMGGGFLGRGAKIRGGNYTFEPGEWKRVDSTADDLKKSLFPLPAVESSDVLFKALTLLIDYTNRVSSSVDILVGQNPGQNTPAETSRTMVEQGQKIYSAIFKRLWRSMKEEFKKIYILNALYLPLHERGDFLGSPNEVVPAADPNVTSDGALLQRALQLKQTAMTTSGYNLEEVERDFLRALKVDDIDRIYPGPDKVKPLTNPKVQIEQMKLQAKQMQFEHEQKMFMVELMEQRRLNDAKIIELKAKAMKAMAEADAAKNHSLIEALNTAINTIEVHNDGLKNQIDLLQKGGQDGQSGGQGAGAGQGSAGMGRMVGVAGGNTIPQMAPSTAGELEGGLG